MAVYIAAQAARGLHYAHTRIDEVTRKPLEIVHRDISPQNLLISFEGEVKVIDFGIAKFEAKNQETKPGVVKGKYSYMSPEQVTAKPLDARTDVFSLSIVLWEVLAMKRLFAGESEVETIKNVQNGLIKRPIRDYNKQVDDHLSAILVKGLSKDRRKRYQSAAEFEKDLLKYLNLRYPDFTASDLGNFVRQIFSKKRSDIQKVIQKLLSEKTPDQVRQQYADAVGTPPTNTDLTNTQTNTQTYTNKGTIYKADPLDKRTALDLNDASNAAAPLIPLAKGINQRVAIDVTQPAPENRTQSRIPQSGHSWSGSRANLSNASSPARGNYRSTHSYRKQQFSHRRGSRPNTQIKPKVPTFFLGTVVAIALVSLGLMLQKSSSPAMGTMQIKINTQPNRIVLKVDGKIQEEGRYITTPTTIKLPAGRHSVEVSRHGYHAESVSINGKPGEVYDMQKIGLKRDASKKFVELQMYVNPRQKVVVDIDRGWYRGPAPRTLNGLTAGEEHVIEVYPNPPTRKDAFMCQFAPNPNSTSYVLELVINAKGQSKCIAK